jgi:hypothetical protein
MRKWGLSEVRMRRWIQPGNSFGVSVFVGGGSGGVCINDDDFVVVVVVVVVVGMSSASTIIIKVVFIIVIIIESPVAIFLATPLVGCHLLTFDVLFSMLNHALPPGQ